MKFLADECCTMEVVLALREDGHDVLYVKESMRGSSDNDLLHVAFQSNCILITEDKDFGEIVYRQRLPAYGIVLLRFDVKHDEQKSRVVRELVRTRAEKLLNAFVVVESDKIRFRPLNS